MKNEQVIQRKKQGKFNLKLILLMSGWWVFCPFSSRKETS
jgi:hypothetical protein